MCESDARDKILLDRIFRTTAGFVISIVLTVGIIGTSGYFLVDYIKKSDTIDERANAIAAAHFEAEDFTWVLDTYVTRLFSDTSSRHVFDMAVTATVYTGEYNLPIDNIGMSAEILLDQYSTKVLEWQSELSSVPQPTEVSPASMESIRSAYSLTIDLINETRLAIARYVMDTESQRQRRSNRIAGIQAERTLAMTEAETAVNVVTAALIKTQKERDELLTKAHDEKAELRTGRVLSVAGLAIGTIILIAIVVRRWRWSDINREHFQEPD